MGWATRPAASVPTEPPLSHLIWANGSPCRRGSGGPRSDYGPSPLAVCSGLSAHPARRAGWVPSARCETADGRAGLSQRHADAAWSPAGSRHASQPQSLSIRSYSRPKPCVVPPGARRGRMEGQGRPTSLRVDRRTPNACAFNENTPPHGRGVFVVGCAGGGYFTVTCPSGASKSGASSSVASVQGICSRSINEKLI